MTGQPVFLIEQPIPDAPVPGPAGSDVLSDALNLFRFTGAALLRAEITPPGAWNVPEATNYARVLHPGATRMLVLHIVAKGSCWIEADGIPRRHLPQGSIIGFPLGDAHILGVGEVADPAPIAAVLPPPPWTELPVLRNGESADTRLVCVYLRCDELLSNPVLSSLPPLMIVSPREEVEEDWIEANVGYIVKAALEGGPGCASLIARLTELLFIEILRRHIARQEGATGWLAALADRHLSRALAGLHKEPARDWTLDEVARQAGMSRSALTDSFQRVLETSPMRYLTMWRLQLAAQALQSTHKNIARIAEDVGYSSEAALSRAFKRETGCSPAQWREARRG